METTTVNWHCSSCSLPLHLSGTLWRTDDGQPFCKAAAPDVIAEQYAAAGLHRAPVPAPSRMHIPHSDWVHPALRKDAP